VSRLDHVEQATQALLGLLDREDWPQWLLRGYLRPVDGGRPSDGWSLGNRMLMWLSGTEDARGYRQWQAVGRHVKAGARAIYILAPITRTVMVTEPDPETGEPRAVPQHVTVGFQAIPVFRIEDTEGAEVPPVSYEPPSPPPLIAVAQAWGYRVTYGPGDGICYGWTRPDAREMHLMTHDPTVFWHELGHAADARNRTLRGGQEPDQEIVAEAVAAVLALLHGYTPTQLGNQLAYLKAYADAARCSPLVATMRMLHWIEQALTAIRVTAEAVAEADAVALGVDGTDRP